MRTVSRYPRSPETAAPGKPVRTRGRPAVSGAAAGSDGFDIGGGTIAYLGRTLLPLAGSVKRQSTYTVQAGDRLDNLTARLLGDPTLFWVLLEANNVSDPAWLCAVPGRKIVVPALAGQNSSPLHEPLLARRTTAAAPSAHIDDAQEETP
jgi:nucleoid-associated protein YgaU